MSSNRIRFVVIALLSAAAFAYGAAPVAKTPAADKPKPPPIVTIKKNDGSSVRCQIVSSDAAHLTIKPVEGNRFGDATELAWSDVKSVSNGLAREKALAAWKIEHKAELCDTCHGDGHVECAICKGTGHDPDSSKDCPTCKGELLVDCPDKHCDAGKIPCPGPCLKLSQGTWSKPEADGKRWRTFPVGGGGTFRVSTGHLGEVVKLGKRGEQPSLTPCEICGKTGTITCPTCGGDHKIACPTCKANKSAADCAACEAGQVTCKDCKGTGYRGGAAPTIETTPPERQEDAPKPAAPAPAPAAPAKPAKPSTGDNDGF